jgi:hypothetical protein
LLMQLFLSPHLPASCTAVASRNWKASWTSGGWASRREARGRRLGKEHRSGSSGAFALERLRQIQINHVPQIKRGGHIYHLTGTV